MEERISILTYAVRPRVVAKYVSQLGIMLALLTLLPLFVALLEAEWLATERYAIICIVLSGAGLAFTKFPTPNRIQGNEALTITALAFILSPLIMSWPMMAAHISFFDALFEAVSGITTTGLSTVIDIEHRSNSFLFARAWMQWYGGLGIVVLSVGLLMGHHAAARRLAEPVDPREGFVSAARTHARHTLIIYLGLTIVGMFIMWPLAGDSFNAMLHVLSAVSTGGYSSFNNSLGGLERNASIALMIIAFFSAVSLALYWRVGHAGWRKGLQLLLYDVELRTFLIACVISGGLLGVIASLHHIESPWYHGLMMGFSAQSTTGFSTYPVAELDPVSKLIMIVSMLIGGGVGSTAGGFKILRLLIFLRMLQMIINRTAMPPHAVATPYLAGQKLEGDDLLRALQLILLFACIVFLSWLPFVAMGYDPLDALFEVASASGTVGLSSGITRPDLEPLLKAVLCFDMLAGRLEIVALLVVLYPRNWLGRREAIQ
jgi:trk system potassium uptake protein TrkH